MLNDIERSWYHWMIGFLIPHIEHGHFWQNEQVNIASMKVLFSAGTPGDFCKEPTRHTRWNWTSSNSGQPWQFRASNCSWNLPLSRKGTQPSPVRVLRGKSPNFTKLGILVISHAEWPSTNCKSHHKNMQQLYQYIKKNQDFASHFSWSRRVVIQ